ncbi:MAG: sulfatase-like hydrolase/transferase, partial [bacterium]|nr:sulfatase-like hydrolase/transferase [bacterium]
AREHHQPFFLAVGIFRPHMPFFAPQRFFDLYPADSVVMPERKEGDLDDIPAGGMALIESKLWFWRGMSKAEAARAGTWRDAVRAYQASATFADSQVGRVLDAVEANGHSDNTVIILWSDHGYHLGEKDHWEKFMLWEKTTHVPLVVVAPGVTQPGMVCNRPVDLTAIYPTLVELCGLAEKPELEGASLVPLLRDAKAPRERPALMTYGRGNHAVRGERWRYIRYADGTEELYDHSTDPNEWDNVAGSPENAAVIEDLARWLPETNAPEAPPMERPQR